MSSNSWLPNLFGRDRSPVADSFSSLQREINRLFEDFGSLTPWTVPTGDTGMRVVPRIDLVEAEDGFRVTVELPGVAPADIDIALTDNTLVIKGEKKAETERKDRNYHLVERHYGRFQRNVALPAEVETDKVSAEFDQGVLTVVLPKAPQSAQRARRIAISRGGAGPAAEA